LFRFFDAAKPGPVAWADQLFKGLGWRGCLGLVLALGERLLANVLLRAEQGAEALMARGGYWVPADQLHQMAPAALLPNVCGLGGLVALLLLRWKAGAL
jgi:energy-coupling factor transport system permease protein